jgi:hypothetical protein
MEPIEEHRARNGSINLVILKAEILSALSGVGSATTTEELRQADAAYRKALYAARSIGYCPHIRAADGQQIKVEWVALAARGGTAHVSRSVTKHAAMER